MNDFILILQMKQGNDQAFDKFVRKYYADILSYCRYHCLNQTEAEDLTQETFLRFINNIQSYQHMGKAKNYLYVIAGNLCKNSAKKWKAESIETEVSQADATKMMKQFKVSNMKSERGMVELRIIADRPPIPEACVVEPTLEDVFLYYFGEKGGETE